MTAQPILFDSIQRTSTYSQTHHGFDTHCFSSEHTNSARLLMYCIVNLAYLSAGELFREDGALMAFLTDI